MKHKIMTRRILFFLFFYIVGCSMTVNATTESSTVESVQTRKFATQDNYNEMGPKDVWNACRKSISLYQNEIDLITNILIAVFVIIAGIVFIYNCIRLSTIESHPLAKKQEYVSLLYTVVGISGLGGVFFFAKFIVYLVFGI